MEAARRKMGPNFRLLEINGGVVDESQPETTTLWLPPTSGGYADAQFDDYAPHGRTRTAFNWQPGVVLRLAARFSHEVEQLQGTAGFGFWNAPFGDPTINRPALPQATWFFFASSPSDLPLAASGPGRGWFAATLDAGRKTAVSLIPLAPFILLLNQSVLFRRRLWPLLRQRLAISFAPIAVPLTAWHTYELAWLPGGCRFTVDGVPVLQTPHSPRGPLGFVCWLDNQYMVATNNGRFRWGVLPTTTTQWLEVQQLTISPAHF
jgi:hypothetical protein